jgi:hypothetical protein
MVAPSLVTVISPSGEIRILSRPLGPRDVLTILATVFAARMWVLMAWTPCDLVFFACSLRMINGLPYFEDH